MTSVSRRGLRLTALIGGTAVLALGLGACSGGGSGDGSGGGDGVPFGASAEEWQAAFEDIDPITIVWETAGAANTPGGQILAGLVERAAELSGGKVTIEPAFSLSVSGSLTEADQALQDGRIDIAMITPYLESQEYPIGGTIANDVNVLFPTAEVGGFLAGWAAAEEALWGTPEFLAENHDVGIYPLSPYSAGSRSVLACKEEITSLADLSGKQIRVAPITNFHQVEALGAIPVSIPFSELFESVQRGLVDCIIAGPSTIGGLPGLPALLPYVIAPVGTNWSSTVAFNAAGLNWESYPLVVQQLLYDLNADYAVLNQEPSLVDMPFAVYEEVTAAGGAWLGSDADVNEALDEFNSTLVEGWRGSPHLDGEAFVSRFDEALTKWTALLEDAGITFAEFSEVDVWSTADIDWDAFIQLYYDEVVEPNRP